VEHFFKDLKLVPVKFGLCICLLKNLKSNENYFCEMLQCCTLRAFVISKTVVCMSLIKKQIFVFHKPEPKKICTVKPN